jgi:hypothetical protein
MPGESLARLREQADHSAPEIRAAALLRIARVESAFDLAAALNTFDAAISAIRKLNDDSRLPLIRQARIIAAAIAPERIAALPLSEEHGPRMPYRFHEQEMLNTMVDYGHIDSAITYVLAEEREEEEREERAAGVDSGHSFPYGAIPKLIASTPDPARQLALLRHAVEAWRAGPGPGPGGMYRTFFAGLFRRHWGLLPESEALAIVRQIVDDARMQPARKIQARYDPEGSVEITSVAEHTIFEVFNILRALDPALAESLTSEYSQLAAAVRRFPNGMESVIEEAHTRQEAMRKQGGLAAGGGFGMAGDPREFPYLRSLIDASRDGNFDPPFAHALERYAEDSSGANPNLAPRELWPSANAFRTVAYKSGKLHGAEAARYLARIPDDDLRLFAAIELEAALAGLPELKSMISRRQARPQPRRAPSGFRPQTEGAASSVSGPHIRCPKCGWQPRADDRWACNCGHMWNTFDTGGVCPSCVYRWKITQCLECLVVSAHSDWYAQA